MTGCRPGQAASPDRERVHDLALAVLGEARAERSGPATSFTAACMTTRQVEGALLASQCLLVPRTFWTPRGIAKLRGGSS